MNLTAYDIALIAGGFTIIGALIGALTTYYCALELARLNAKREAGRRLREAFNDVLTTVKEDSKFIQSGPSDSGPAVELSRLLKEVSSIQGQAVTEFSFHLKGKHKEQFDAAWQHYCSFEHFFLRTPGTTCELFISAVDAILKFTLT